MIFINATKYVYRILLLFIITLSFCVQATEKLTVITGINKPPYVIQSHNSGFEIELVRNIFHTMGKSVEFTYVNYARAARMLNSPDVDAVMSTNSRVFSDQSILTAPYVTYHNVAVSLKAQNIKLDSISDLASYSIASFQLAHKVLGQEFFDATTQSPLFVQMSRQIKQPEMLFRNRVQTLVMDEQIFFYMLSQSEWAGEKHKVIIHRIFPANHYSMAFKDKNNVSLFNRALKTVLASPEYLQLIKKYGFNRAGQY